MTELLLFLNKGAPFGNEIVSDSCTYLDLFAFTLQ